MAEVRALQCRGFLWNYSYPVVRLGLPVIGVNTAVDRVKNRNREKPSENRGLTQHDIFT